jgi:hypothetical protein
MSTWPEKICRKTRELARTDWRMADLNLMKMEAINKPPKRDVGRLETWRGQNVS